MPSMAELAAAKQTLGDEYRRVLGREASDADLRGQLGNYQNYGASNVQHALANIRNSDEAKAFAARNALAPGTTPPATGTTPPATGTGTTPPPAAGAPATAPDWLKNAPAATNRWGGSGYDYTGFNFNRDQDVTKSAKDAFAYGASLGERAGAGNMWHTKQGAQQFAELYLKPYLEQQGFKVLGVNGDQIHIVTREDEAAGNTAGSWFDFVVNADGSGQGLTPQLAWQIQSGTGAGGAMPVNTPGQYNTPTTPTTASPTTPTTPTTPSAMSPEAYRALANLSPADIQSLAELIPTLKPGWQQNIAAR